MCKKSITLTPCDKCGVITLALVDNKWTGDCLYDGVCFNCWKPDAYENIDERAEDCGYDTCIDSADLFPKRIELYWEEWPTGKYPRVHVYHKDKDDWNEFGPAIYLNIGM